MTSPIFSFTDPIPIMRGKRRREEISQPDEHVSMEVDDKDEISTPHYSKKKKHIPEHDAHHNHTPPAFHPGNSSSPLLTTPKPKRRIGHSSSFHMDEAEKDELRRYHEATVEREMGSPKHETPNQGIEKPKRKYVRKTNKDATPSKPRKRERTLLLLQLLNRTRKDKSWDFGTFLGGLWVVCKSNP